MTESQAALTHGKVCWHECTTKDADAATKFYTELFGWTTSQMDMGELGQYTMLHHDGVPFGGVMPMTGPEWGDTPSHWMTYIAVDDVDAAAKRAEELGGKVCVPPTDIPVGRFAVITDPAGATFSLYKAAAAAPPDCKEQ